MMQMLAAGGMPLLTDGIRAADADNPRGYFEYEPVKRTRHDTTWAPLAEGKAVKMVYALLRDLPPGHDYRVILMRRDLGETIASQRAMLRRSNRAGAEVSDDKLRALFANDLEAANRWLASQPNFRTLGVEHRDCLTAPAAVAARLNAFLGGSLDEAAMAAVVDPTLHRQRTTSSSPKP